MPPEAGPASRIISILPARSLSTWLAVVGEMEPEMLALGAARGTPAISSNLRVTNNLGMRSATLEAPAVTQSGTRSFLSSTMVKGPGQNASASFWAHSFQFNTRLFACSTECT